MKLTEKQLGMIAAAINADPKISARDLADVAGVSLTTAKLYKKNGGAIFSTSERAAKAAETVKDSDIVHDLQKAARIGASTLLRQFKILEKLIDDNEKAEDPKVMKPDELRSIALAVGMCVTQANNLKEKPRDLANILDAAPEELEYILKNLLEEALSENGMIRAIIDSTIAAEAPAPEVVSSVPQLNPAPGEDFDDQDGLPPDPNDGYPGPKSDNKG